MEQIKQLAAEMGVTESDLIGFLFMLHHHMDKGMTMEAAIRAVQRHGDNIVQWAYRMQQDKEFRTYIAEQVWESVNGES